MVAFTKRPTEAWRSAKLFEDGAGYVVVARFKLSGEAEVGGFLLDVHCRGVKDAFLSKTWEADYERELLPKVFRDCEKLALTPACARKLVEDAVAYARRFALEPHPDYRLAARVFGGLNAADCAERFTFGRDGKPFYIQGPRDDDEFVREVITKLRTHAGPDGFDYILTADAAGHTAADDLLPREKRLIGPEGEVKLERPPQS